MCVCVCLFEGDLKTFSVLDYEEDKLHRMKVRALDGGGRFCESEVEVAVDDVNDNAPRFAADPLAITVFENTETHTPVARLQASDLDTGELRPLKGINPHSFTRTLNSMMRRG